MQWLTHLVVASGGDCHDNTQVRLEAHVHNRTCLLTMTDYSILRTSGRLYGPLAETYRCCQVLEPTVPPRSVTVWGVGGGNLMEAV